MTPKKIVILLIAIAVVLIGLGIWFGSWFLSMANPSSSGPSPYSAVYMTTGDIYYGKLSWFPSPHLTGVWFLQRGQNAQGQAQLGLAPFTSAFWGPIDEVYLNPSQIIFWARLRNDSQLTQAFQNPSTVPTTPAPTSAAPTTTPTSTFRGPSGPPPSGSQ